MEQGTLSIRKTKKGFHVEIQYTKKSGKSGILAVSVWQPKDDALNGTPCQFEREGGTLTKLVAHDGKILYELGARATPSHTSSSGTSSMGNAVADSYAPGATMLPKDTKEALRRINPENFFLKWQKCARHENPNAKNPFAFFRTHKGEVSFQIQPNFGDIDFEKLATRERSNTEQMLGPNNVRAFEYTTSWRMVQGLGMESVYEVSMTLHHIYGIPYIPATALKGVVRSWIIDQVFDKKEEKAIADKSFCDWFGCPGELLIDRDGKKTRHKSFYGKAHRGNLIFLDAYPLEPPRIMPDVMNPHYSEYYQDNKNEKPPADYYNPIPVYFLIVEGTRFQFVFGAFQQDDLIQTIHGKTIDDWTRDALQNHGIGAKTAVGYGYMTSS